MLNLGVVSPQFSTWVDAVIFVFSLENESSFNAIYHYYSKMNFFRNTAEIPIILVGTQGMPAVKCEIEMFRKLTGLSS